MNYDPQNQIDEINTVNKLLKFAVIGTLSIFLVFLVFGCQPKRAYVPVFFASEKTDQLKLARDHAANQGGMVYSVRPTGSMQPDLEAGDVIVVVPIEWEEVRPGMMLTYQASWLPRTSPPTTHWCAESHGDGYIMDGSNNKHYEKGKLTMYEEDFMYRNKEGNRVGGKVIAIYRLL